LKLVNKNGNEKEPEIVLINEVDVYKRVGKIRRLIPQISSNELIVNRGDTGLQYTTSIVSNEQRLKA